MTESAPPRLVRGQPSRTAVAVTAQAVAVAARAQGLAWRPLGRRHLACAVGSSRCPRSRPADSEARRGCSPREIRPWARPGGTPSVGGPSACGPAAAARRAAASAGPSSPPVVGWEWACGVREPRLGTVMVPGGHSDRRRCRRRPRPTDSPEWGCLRQVRGCRRSQQELIRGVASRLGGP